MKTKFYTYQTPILNCQ